VSKSKSDVTLARVFALNPMKTIADFAATDVYAAIEELIANQYDEDSRVSEVFFDGGTLTLKDDGSGMLPEDLVYFYQVGGSPKVREPISPEKKRIRIGKFGVGTILLDFLCEEYDLYTMKDGVRTTVKERFTGELTEGKEIPYRTENVDHDLHGTTLILKKLRFAEGESFDLEKLHRRLAWAFLPEDEFHVELNGELVEPKLDRFADKFEYEINGRDIGQVQLEIYYSNATTEHAGVHVYVNGRRVGRQEDFLDLGKIRADFERRLVVKIKANGLNDAIHFNREHFDTNHPTYVNLQRAVKRRLMEVKSSAEGKQRTSPSVNIRRRMSELRKDVEWRLNERALWSKIGASRRLTLLFNEEVEKDHVGEIDFSTGELSINLEHPSLAITPDMKPLLFKHMLLSAALETIAGTMCKGNHNVYRREIAKMWTFVLASDVAPVEMIRGLLPGKLYNVKQLAEFTDLSPAAIRRMFDAEIVNQDSQGRVRGKEMIDIERKLDGFTSLFDVARRVHGDKYDFAAVERIERRLESANDMEPFAIDCSAHPRVRSFFFYDLCADYVFDRLAGTEVAQAATVAERLRDTYLSVYQLSLKGGGITSLPKDVVNRVLSDARKNRLTIREKFQRQMIRVHLGDFVSACQALKIGGENGDT